MLPLWKGAGTVKVIIGNADMEEASDELVQKVTAAIEELRPIGATVTVVSVKPKSIAITGTVVGSVDMVEFKDKVKAFLKEKGFGMEYLSIAHIGKILLECKGVEDYTKLLLDGTSENIPIAEEDMPTIGEVNFRV